MYYSVYLTDWGPAYPPPDYVMDTQILPSQDWEDVPCILKPPGIIGYPIFIPELDAAIRRDEVEVVFVCKNRTYPDAHNRWQWRQKKQVEMFDRAT